MANSGFSLQKARDFAPQNAPPVPLKRPPGAAIGNVQMAQPPAPAPQGPTAGGQPILQTPPQAPRQRSAPAGGREVVVAGGQRMEGQGSPFLGTPAAQRPQMGVYRHLVRLEGVMPDGQVYEKTVSYEFPAGIKITDIQHGAEE